MTQQIDTLRERFDRLVRLVELNAPDVIVADVAAHIVESMTILWPGLWTRLGTNMQGVLRNHSGVCCACGETEIPALLTHPIECRSCDALNVESMQKCGVDPNQPNPPDVEEMLVDLTNAESSKVNSLPEYLLDDLERMLESRDGE